MKRKHYLILGTVAVAAVLALVVALLDVGSEDNAVVGTIASQATLQGDLDKLESRLAQPDTRSKLSSEQWTTYGKSVSQALASGHDGLTEAALRITIQYGNQLELKKPAAMDLVKVYRNHPNDRVRRMAVAALGRVQDPWSMDFLRRSLEFEKSDEVRHTMNAVVAEYFVAAGDQAEAQPAVLQE